MTDITPAPEGVTPEAERPAYLIRKHGGYYRPNCRGYTDSAIQAGRYTLEQAVTYSHPNGPDGPRDGMSYIHEDEVTDLDWRAYRTLAADRDAQKARADAAEQERDALIAARDAMGSLWAQDYAHAAAAEAKVARLVEAATVLHRSMELFFEADEAADEAEREGRQKEAARLRNMANGRWQSIPGNLDALAAIIAEVQG